MNNFITALKENRNDIRKKVIIVAGITVAAVAAGVILTKLNAQKAEEVILVLSEAGENISDAATE